jgi:hypothetical protein
MSKQSSSPSTPPCCQKAALRNRALVVIVAPERSRVLLRLDSVFFRQQVRMRGIALGKECPKSYKGVEPRTLHSIGPKTMGRDFNDLPREKARRLW